MPKQVNHASQLEIYALKCKKYLTCHSNTVAHLGKWQKNKDYTKSGCPGEGVLTF